MVLNDKKRKLFEIFLLNETLDNPFCDRELAEDYDLSLNRVRKIKREFNEKRERQIQFQKSNPTPPAEVMKTQTSSSSSAASSNPANADQNNLSNPDQPIDPIDLLLQQSVKIPVEPAHLAFYNTLNKDERQDIVNLYFNQSESNIVEISSNNNRNLKWFRLPSMSVTKKDPNDQNNTAYATKYIKNNKTNVFKEMFTYIGGNDLETGMEIMQLMIAKIKKTKLNEEKEKAKQESKSALEKETQAVNEEDPI